MSGDALRVAVVGHTNTGKTSLLRTLTRDVDFGEVSPSPAVTQHVEGASLLVDGHPIMELYDTPGLEDSIGLLDYLHATRGDRRTEGVDLINAFLDGPDAGGRFEQEAKALRQVLASDVALYVVDARDRVLAKHRDELEILALCARPVVPVLNFTASAQAQTPLWRDQMSRANMHAVAEFDTVVLDDQSERRLLEKMRTLLDAHSGPIQSLIDERERQRGALRRASAGLVADMLVDVAAYVVNVPAVESSETHPEVAALKETARRREQTCVDRLLELHQFRTEDCRPDEVPIIDGRWGLDLFSPEAVKQFGISAGSAAAAGALAGLAIDAATGGLSLGAGAAVGATIGGLIGAARTHGRRVLGRLRGYSELRCDDSTLTLLAARQVLLVRALLRRGHASIDPVKLDAEAARPPWSSLPRALSRAKTHPTWSSLGVGREGWHGADVDREGAVDEVARKIQEAIRH